MNDHLVLLISYMFLKFICKATLNVGNDILIDLRKKHRKLRDKRVLPGSKTDTTWLLLANAILMPRRENVMNRKRKDINVTVYPENLAEK